MTSVLILQPGPGRLEVINGDGDGDGDGDRKGANEECLCGYYT